MFAARSEDKLLITEEKDLSERLEQIKASVSSRRRFVFMGRCL